MLVWIGPAGQEPPCPEAAPHEAYHGFANLETKEISCPACACACTPPPGLRDLLGIARLDAVDDRLAETGLLIQLREALADVEGYSAALDVVTDEAAQILAFRLGASA